ncbi:MAG: DUF2802 domain-containing protein [Gammaproteobacteria bacterium]|nr:DUF2802 domain-containing protein [Gammaproteobacteria bacterium]
MAIFDTLDLGSLAAGIIEPGLLDGFLAGTVTLHPAATLAGSLLALLAISTLAISALRQKRRIRLLEACNQDATDRLQAIEILLANSTSETSLLRQRIEQLGIRQESAPGNSAKTSLRQAIALSRHGATTRQLIDTCELSQGEAHLIQTLYGQPACTPAPELH